MLTMFDPQLLFGAAAVITSLAALVTAFRTTRAGHPGVPKTSPD